MSLQYLPEPVRNFLKLDSYNSKDIEHSVISFLPFSQNSRVQAIVKNILFERVMPYYAKHRLEANTGVYNFLVEPLKNANFHGPKNCAINFELFLVPSVLAASYCDGGNYFKRQEVKDAWENRIRFPEKHDAGVYGIGCDVGTELIYDLADLIHVDISTGTLYTGWMVKKFCR